MITAAAWATSALGLMGNIVTVCLKLLKQDVTCVHICIMERVHLRQPCLGRAGGLSRRLDPNGHPLTRGDPGEE